MNFIQIDYIYLFLMIILSLIWQELRFNVYQLDIMKKNYHFYFEDLTYFEIGFARFENIYKLADKLKNNVYQAYLNSEAITAIASGVFNAVEDSDRVFNNLEVAY